MKRAVLGLLVVSMAVTTVAASPLTQMMRQELRILEKMQDNVIAELQRHDKKVESAWVRLERESSDLLRAQEHYRKRPMVDILSHLGGAREDEAFAVAADGRGYAYVAGTTTSKRFDSDRNWPAELGELPVRDVAQEIQVGHVRRAIDEGMQPSAVASMVIDAVRNDRYWVIPHGDWMEIALERWHRVAERQNPEPPEEFPGMPPRSEMIAEVMAAMAQAMGADPS